MTCTDLGHNREARTLWRVAPVPPGVGLGRLRNVDRGQEALTGL
jgi:hypothetical protein